MSWNDNGCRLPDDIEVGEPKTISQIKRQGVSWEEEDWQLDKSFGRENDPRCVLIIGDTGKPNHPDIPKPEHAWNFTGDRTVDDSNWHSTWISGKCVALNNDIGYQGLCPDDTLFWICKVLNNQGYGSNMLAGMRKALETWKNDPRRKSGELLAAFYNMSYGGGGYSSAEDQLFREMIELNMIPIAASGNEGRSRPSWPASSQATFSVGAYDRNRNKASFTNYGPWTDFVGPGVGAYSTVGRNQYAPMNGTSMACPSVMCCLANFISSRPSDKWLHNFHGLKEGVSEFMLNLPD